MAENTTKMEELNITTLDDLIKFVDSFKEKIYKSTNLKKDLDDFFKILSKELTEFSEGEDKEVEVGVDRRIVAHTLGYILNTPVIECFDKLQKLKENLEDSKFKITEKTSHFDLIS